MPRASLSPMDAESVKLGVQEGNIEIINACTRVHQYPPNKDTGNQSDPFLCVQLEVNILDSSWNRVPDTDSEFIELGLGGKALAKFHPGNGEGVDDMEPEDLGEEVGTEGNCLYAVEETSRLNNKCKWIRFAESMMTAGVKPEKLRGWMPDLIGIKGHVKTLTEKANFADSGEKNVNQLVMDKLAPASSKSKAPAPPAKSPAPPAKTGKTASKTATQPTPPADGGGSDDAIKDLAKELIGNVLSTPAAAAKFTGKENVAAKSLRVEVQTEMIRKRRNRDEINAVKAMMEDPDALLDLGADMGFIYDKDSDTLTFPG